jgi:hypothetical protein
MSDDDHPYHFILLQIEFEVRMAFQLEPTILGDLLSELHCMATHLSYIDGVLAILPDDPEAAVRTWIQRRLDISRLFLQDNQLRRGE